MTSNFFKTWRCLASTRCSIPPSSCINMSTSTQNSKVYDIVIVGGGMVGGAMACAIGRSSFLSQKRVLLLDSMKKKNQSLSKKNGGTYGTRVCAISPGNAEFLEKLGAWKLIPHCAPVKKMQVWDSCSNGMITFEQNNMSEDLCYVVENDMITGSFSKLLESKFNDQVEVQYNCKVVSCENPQNFAFKDGRQSVPLVTLKLSDDTEVKTRLLIAADGANSFIAQSCGVNYFKRPYDQSAVVSNLRLHERGENIVAWQRFLPTGPIALLPLDETTSSLVWSTTHQHAKKLLEMQEDEFVSEINNAFWQDYSQQDIVKSLESFTSMLLSFAKSGNDVVMQYPPSVASIAGDRFKFPLGCSHANEYVKPRVAFIGDSIHRVHPLAGQGVNLGFRDVDCLSRVLDKAAYEGKDLGAINHLMEFESEQQKSNIPFVTAVHSLKHMFSTDSTPLVAIRSIGLTLCNSNSVLKKRFIEQATT